MEAIAANTLALYLDAAPWLLLGLLAAGLIKAWVPDDLIGRWLGGQGLWPVTKAALVGAPLPLCSCGVLPAALGLHRNGASRGSTVSFLISTPETGVDSIAVSYAMLGPFMTIVRPVAAVFSAIFTGLLSSGAPSKQSLPIAEVSSCSGGSCCSSGCSTTAVATEPNALQRVGRGLRYAMTDILDDISLWLALGIVVAGLVTTWVPPMTLSEWGSGLPAMLLMLLIGVPMYICATASTPLAAALLLAGISPGTVLVFLLAGPATNMATVAVVHKELGHRTLITYLLGIAISSIAIGYGVDALVSTFNIDIQAQLAESSELVPPVIAWISGAMLALFAIKPIRRLIL